MQALIVTDIQYDFCPGGALAVAGGEEIIPLVNRLMARFSTVVATQDWHPADHTSFAAQHAGRQPFELIDLPYGAQVLWPVHCVMGSRGAALHEALEVDRAHLIIRKGSHRQVDSYSAFLEADRVTRTGLDGYLASRGVAEVYICGLATDYCVAWTAEDCCAAGFRTFVIEDACRAIDLDGSLARAWDRLAGLGVARVSSVEVG